MKKIAYICTLVVFLLSARFFWHQDLQVHAQANGTVVEQRTDVVTVQRITDQGGGNSDKKKTDKATSEWTDIYAAMRSKKPVPAQNSLNALNGELNKAMTRYETVYQKLLNRRNKQVAAGYDVAPLDPVIAAVRSQLSATERQITASISTLQQFVSNPPTKPRSKTDPTPLLDTSKAGPIVSSNRNAVNNATEKTRKSFLNAITQLKKLKKVK